MRGVAGTGVIPQTAKCIRCGARYRQHADGLCRICHRANETSDPVALAIARIRRFIGKRHVEANHMDYRRSKMAREQAVEADNALDLLSEKLREGA